jgi:sulfate adenylyltransferase
MNGICLWMTGLSGSGKSTTANHLLSMTKRPVTLLDGDVVRAHLSKGLGFSKADRDTNVLRIGFVASEILKHGGMVICSCISPYRVTRDKVREMMKNGRFIEIFINTPLEICEKRDPKGLYNKARMGQLSNLTGINDPYEPPLNPEIILKTELYSVEDNCLNIMKFLGETEL